MRRSRAGASRSSMKYSPTKRILTTAMTMMASAVRVCPPWLWPSALDNTVARVRTSQTAEVRVRRSGARAVMAGLLADQVEQGEQHDPQQVDHVPETSAAFCPAELLGGQRGLAAGVEQVCEHCQPKDQVETVQPGECVVEHEELVGQRGDPERNLVVVFDDLQDRKGQPGGDRAGDQRGRDAGDLSA